MRIRWGNLLLAFLVIWILILIYLLVPLWNSSGQDDLAKKLLKFTQENEKLSQENFELRSLLKKLQAEKESQEYKSQDKDHNTDKKIDEKSQNNNDGLQSVVAKYVNGPTKDYEMTRRQIMRDTNEMWWYIRSRLDHAIKTLGSSNPEITLWLTQTLKETQHHQKAVLVDLQHLAEVDGHAEWRIQESKELEALVQKRLQTLQNPQDCKSAKKLLCNLNKGCGYGCQLHHAVYCFITAYGTERTLILKSKGWRYNRNGYEEIFQPVSETCQEASGPKKHWPGNEDSINVEIPIIDSINPRPKFLPPSVPKDLSERIMRIHGDPIVWWVSQFLKYLLRPQPETSHMLAEAEKELGFSKPIVGIHVRRTDKVGTEAAFHSVDEYMKYVEEYFEQLEMKEGKLSKKQVYVASDDPKVLAECRKKYPDYEFLGDQKASKSAAVSSRYSSNSLKGIISDIHMLSRTDFLVCTFSSQVCRVAYEIMQYLKPDASDNFKSLDDIWYFGGQDEHQQVAIMDHAHTTREELDLQVGDTIGVAGNHWNGFNKGRNHRAGRIGLYPQYKTRERVKIVDFPTYSHVEL